MQHSMHEAILVSAHYCTCLHLVWNVVRSHAEIVLRIPLDREERKYKRITMAR